MDILAGLDEATLDRARISRDPRFDGKFFIAVRTTGIYCRPICPSPRCKKINVTYYATAAAASAAGYRPCRRCRPEVAPGSPAWLGPSAVVRRALRLIHEGSLDVGSVETLAARVGIGSRHLDRLFLQHVGVSPLAVAQTRRLHFAKQLLDETDLRIIDIAMAAGFGSVRRFNDSFLKGFGKSPRELRRRAKVGTGERSSEFVELKLPHRPPYDWQHLIAFLADNAIEGVERVAADEYTRALALSNAHVIVSVRPLIDESGLSLRVSGAPASALLELSTVAKRVFDLNADPEPIAQVLAADPLLQPLLKKRPGLRVPGVWEPFECAVRAVLGPVAGGVGRQWIERLVKLSGRPISTGMAGLTHLFPTPLAILSGANDELGLPKSRLATLRALARAVHEAKIDPAAQTDDVLRALRAVPGITDDIAQYIALRAYGEPDAFPANDPVLQRLIRDPQTRAQAWRPWRSYAVIHLWEASHSRKSAPGRLRAERAGEITSRTLAAGHAPESA